MTLATPTATIPWLAIGKTQEGALQTDFTLPLDAVTQTFGILAKKGSGKSYTGQVIAEEMLAHGQRIVVLDPTGAWWGLRSSASGKSAGYPVVIIGGLHADVPLTEAAGAALADFAASPGGPSMIIDVSDLRKGARKRFARDFFERLYDAKNRQREPVHLFIDEADEFAPQRVQADEARMVGAIEDIVRRGRIRGLGVTLITQRSAVINWDVLSQIDTLVALRTTAPLDVKRMAEWVQYHADQETAKQAVRDLSTLPIGTAWIFSPGWLQRLARVQINKRRTFDSGATPEVGQPVVAPKVAPIDIAALSAQIAAMVEEAESNDPALLKKRIAELERALAAKPAKAETVTVTVEKPVLQGPELRVAQAIVKDVEHLREQLEAAIRTFEGIGGTIADSITRATGAPRPQTEREAVAAMGRQFEALGRPAGRVEAVAAPRNGVKGPATETAEPLAKVERAILTTLAQWPEGRSAPEVGIITGYSYSAGGFRNGLGRLRTIGAIEGLNKHLRITDVGRTLIGPVEPAPSGRALLEMWLNHTQLGKAERLILRTLADAYPEERSAAQVGEATGYSYTAGGFRNALGKLRTLRLIEGPNASMRASADLV